MARVLARFFDLVTVIVNDFFHRPGGEKTKYLQVFRELMRVHCAGNLEGGGELRPLRYFPYRPGNHR